MATSPTVLVDGSPPSRPSASMPIAPAATKIPLIPLLIAVIAGVVIATIGASGVMYYLARTGRLPVPPASTKKTEGPTSAATHALVLEPILVNLANGGGTSYLRLALTLRVADADERKDAKASSEKESGKGSDERTAAVRDTVLSVLGLQTADDLLAADGKDHLKTALRSAFAEHNPDLTVTDVFFTDFLVQR
jgi:flagellar protein FliL